MLKIVVLLNVLWKLWYIFSGLFDEYKVQNNILFETEIFRNIINVFTVSLLI